MYTTPLQYTDTSYGLASVMSLGCLTCIDDANSDARRRKDYMTLEPNEWAADKHSTKNELCEYNINIRFCLVLQLMGVGGEQVHILTSFLDLPEPHKWPRQCSVLEMFLHTTTETVKFVSQEKATEEEAIETDTPDSNISQSLIEDAIPCYRIEAISCDMG